MLITLRGPEYLPALDQYANDDDFASFISILGEILRRGDHAIHAPPLLLGRFSQWKTLSRDQSVALHDMAREVSTGALHFAKVTDSLVLSGPTGPMNDPAGDTRWHRRDWTWLCRKGRLDETVLGGENLNDARWYRWLGRAWSARLRPNSLSTTDELSLKCRGLGGDTARQEVPHVAGEGDPILCILDTDRNHPDATLGGTAKAAIKALKGFPENLSPISNRCRPATSRIPFRSPWSRSSRAKTILGSTQ